MGKRVAIVGAGPCGLPAIKIALDYGLVPTVFEKGGEIGGTWVYKPYETEESSVMKSTVMNSSKEMSAYSTFPPDKHAPNYMHHLELLEYFRNYARHYNLEKCIRFRHNVVHVERASHYESTKQWIVRYTNEKKEHRSQYFDAVLLAVGHHKTPHWPDPFPCQDKFQGRISHAHSYKYSDGYEDKVCVVVGIGNSGADIAVELSRVAKKTYLSTRRGTWLRSRVDERGLPFDISFGNRVWQCLMPSWLYEKKFEAELSSQLDHERFGLKPQHSALSADETINDELPSCIASGRCNIRPDIAKFTKHGIVFTDHQVVEHVDEVIFCTGYNITFPAIENGDLLTVDKNVVETFLYMYPLATADHNTLGILGMVEPSEAVWPVAEMQARVFFAAFTGALKLPSPENMRKDEIKRRKHMQEHLIGAKPKIPRYLFTDPSLAKKLLFGPVLPYSYRLNGPQAWSGAREAILTVDERVVRAPTQPRKPFLDIDAGPSDKRSSIFLVDHRNYLITLFALAAASMCAVYVLMSSSVK